MLIPTQDSCKIACTHHHFIYKKQQTFHTCTCIWLGLGVQGWDWVYRFVTGCAELWLGMRGYVWLSGFTGECLGLRMDTLLLHHFIVYHLT